eukprot:11845232-Heterocapsa_arctica.AAC.1
MGNDESGLNGSDRAVGGAFDAPHAAHGGQKCPRRPSTGADHGGGNFSEAAEIGRGRLGSVGRIEGAGAHVGVQADGPEARGGAHGKGS